ncbi:hypothetical protein [Streptomyces brevispora]|uniref:DUF8175 domain-containing protein n=1 Tax=Streptomyces brevispora TaxID=887462 RepID=A0A561UZ46_9ACTN|nr:hypothetical protein [Streptomyces brevispora]TWG04604.1 hypothetical protein FHX80_113073 [Streptomyces brevispora]WSC14289.1 hypothetical protein OIE64_16525 [Streptomyces brevispora]
MSLGDEDGYGNDSGRSSDGYSTLGGTRQTRTRLPDSQGGDGYGPRRPARKSRSLFTVIGVVVLLLAAIAFANMGGGDGGNGGDGTSGSNGKKTGSAPTAATGTKPVTGKNGEIASGFAHDEQGAQSAASNFAVALGSVEMFKKDSRHTIVDSIYTPEAAGKLRDPQDTAYSPAFLDKLGLDANGNAPQGSTFVSRTVPVGTKLESFDASTAKVSVWYMGLIGMSGPGSTDPVRTAWKTWTVELTWADKDWKAVTDSQRDGPAPVPGDVAASSSDEISKAVEEYGGFTYAR